MWLAHRITYKPLMIFDDFVSRCLQRAYNLLQKIVFGVSWCLMAWAMGSFSSFQESDALCQGWSDCSWSQEPCRGGVFESLEIEDSILEGGNIWIMNARDFGKPFQKNDGKARNEFLFSALKNHLSKQGQNVTRLVWLGSRLAVERGRQLVKLDSLYAIGSTDVKRLRQSGPLAMCFASASDLLGSSGPQDQTRPMCFWCTRAPAEWGKSQSWNAKLKTVIVKSCCPTSFGRFLTFWENVTLRWRKLFLLGELQPWKPLNL